MGCHRNHSSVSLMESIFLRDKKKLCFCLGSKLGRSEIENQLSSLGTGITQEEFGVKELSL